MTDTKIDTNYEPPFKSSVEEIKEANKSTNVELKEEGASFFSNNSGGSSVVNHNKENYSQTQQEVTSEEREKNVKQIPS